MYISRHRLMRACVYVRTTSTSLYIPVKSLEEGEGSLVSWLCEREGRLASLLFGGMEGTLVS